jgi:hypothetical protein
MLQLGDTSWSASILRARIPCAIALISLLSTIVLSPRAASLDPSEILHVTTIMTLCEAYIEIEPHFDLWNNFFHA